VEATWTAAAAAGSVAAGMASLTEGARGRCRVRRSAALIDSGSHKVHPLCEKQPRPEWYPADKTSSFPREAVYTAETYAKDERAK